MIFFFILTLQFIFSIVPPLAADNVPCKPSVSLVLRKGHRLQASHAPTPTPAPSRLPKQPPSSTIVTLLIRIDVQSSSLQSFSNLCGDYTSYLKTVTADNNQPYLVDVNPVFKDSHLLIYTTISSMHLGYRASEYHTNFTLVFDNRVYPNIFNQGSPLPGCNQLCFDIPVTNHYSTGDIITVSILNDKQKRAYKDVRSCVSVPAPQPVSLAVCSYVSDYNTIPELRSWIAFQRVVNVSKVVLYQATPIPGFNEAFGALVREGFVEVVDYTWPRRPVYNLLQCSNQQSQVNACFYRLKYRASAVILCDVDEYVYSEVYPYDLPEVVRFTRRTHPQYDLVTMSANRYSNKENDLSMREENLKEGRLFDAYQYRLGVYESGAFKMMAFDTFNGMLSIHVCFYCTAWKNIPINYARVAHFRVRVKNGSFVHSATLTHYSPLLREQITSITRKTLN